MPAPLLCTEDMVTYLVGDASSVVRAIVKERLYDWKRAGSIKNHGGTFRGGAKWDPVEVLAMCALYAPYSQSVGTTVS